MITEIGWTGTPAREPIVLGKALRLDGKMFLDAGAYAVGTILPGFTFNPWIGCEKVSPACKHCYAEAWSKRVGYTDDGHHHLRVWGPAPTTPRVRTSKANWRRPLAWNKLARRLGTRLKVFCASLADVGEDHPLVEPWRRDLFDLVDATQDLDWLLLTKRANVLRDRWPWRSDNRPRNVWVGATMEDQACAEVRARDIVEIPAAHHFASVEPMIGEIDFSRVIGEWNTNVGDFPRRVWDCPECCGGGYFQVDPYTVACSRCARSPQAFKGSGVGLDWVIIGGESGGGHAELNIAAADKLAQQCRSRGVAVFVKQDSGPQPGMRGRLSDKMWSLKQSPAVRS